MFDEHSTSVSEIVENTQEITGDDVMDEVKQDERRQYPRRAARWSATITTRDKTVVQCKTRDVSERGASIAIPYNFRKNALVILEIHVVYKNIHKKIKMLGQIKHSSVAAEGYTIGVFIKDAPEPTLAFLKAYAAKKF